MKIAKQVLRAERLRQVPEQFSWVDQALVRCNFIDRCDARAAALYLFLVTVADAQGLSYYGASTLARRLRLSVPEFGVARAQLIELDLIAYEAPLYQVLALSRGAPRRAPRVSAPVRQSSAGAVSLAQLIEQAEMRRA